MKGEEPGDTSEKWNLIPLTPEYLEAEHSGYADAIITALDNPTIHNIALSGNFGVGKSSILQRVSVLKKDKVVELSLSTLAPIEASMLDESVPVQATTPTNRIQQEIVKQLLYREEPDKAPGSRFRRIERFKWKRELALAFLLGLVVTLVFMVAGWATTIATVLTPLWNPELWIYPILLALVTGGAFLVGQMLHGRLQIRQLSAGPAAVTLDEKSVSYFDQYLDEIVYFFETSDQDIVIFEDIDRFNDSHIFETLRSLNTLLNASPQINRSIRFVYAIKDSIFDRIGLELEGRKTDATAPVIADPAQAEILRANRTKFFDLVIPVVPFITHRSARNLTAQILRDIEHDVSNDLIDLAGRFVPDMRLLKNVRNEFIVFRSRIFSGDGEKLRLTETDLFAMMLYKSTHLSDFEAIRLGQSRLDVLYARSRELVTANIRRLEQEIRAAELNHTRTAGARVRAQRLGDALLAHISATARTVGFSQNNEHYAFNGTSKSVDDLTSVAFWKQVAEAPDSVTITWRNHNYSGQAMSFTRASLQKALDDRLSADEWTEADRKTHEAALTEKREQLKLLHGADMGTLMRHPEFLVEHDEVEQPLESVAETLLSRGLAFSLIRAGYINRNFTLYTSTFHGDRVSPAATNFIIHHVERDLMDEQFALSEDDVDAVIRERGAQSLGEPALFNIAILDRVLKTNAGQADIMITSLARFDEDARRFLQAYLASGMQRALFARRLAMRSRRVLSYLGNEAELDEETRIELLGEALRGLVDGRKYELDEASAAFLRNHHAAFGVLKERLTLAAANRVAQVFQTAAAKVADLSPLGKAVQKAFVARDLYELSGTNLEVALGADVSLALDSMRDADNNVYNYVLSDLGSYLAAVGAEATTNDDENGFAQTVEDVLESDGDYLEEIVSKASNASRIPDIAKVPEGSWPMLARHTRFPSTFGNVATYIEKVGSLDSDLAEVLARDSKITTGDSREQPERVRLALVILEARTVLSSKLRAELVKSLGVTSYIDVDSITPEHGDLFLHLLRLGIIEDGAATFARVENTNWNTRQNVLKASSGAANLITPIFVGNDLAALLLSSDVDWSVKDVIITRAVEFAPTADRAGLAELANLAITNGKVVGVDVIERMAATGVDWRGVAPLLTSHLLNLSDERLFDILRSLGGSYKQLTYVGWDKPSVQNTPAVLALLDDLERRGIVNTFSRTDDPIKVNKKHKVK
ncbi:DNA-binding protein [Salinibacterium sp. ZJ450]|uniref:YobI family P-loop NTPase n=1 Tax=Salinibacterium sp. ZJ450 TaxID=2708338 RepID=UPI00141F42DA|nr:DNA-binding protein [Salinibacterium sp. ZJ450]